MNWTDIIRGIATGAQIGGVVYQAANAYSQARMSETRADAQRTANEAQAILATRGRADR